MEQNTEEKKGKGGKIRIGVFLVIVFVVIYIPSLLHWVYGKSIPTATIQIGVIEDMIAAEGCFVRDEEVIKPSIDGRCIPEIAEGEKIGVNFKVATILKESSMKLIEEKNDLDLKILQVQKEKNTNQELFSEDIAKIDGEISLKLDQVIEQSNINNLDKVKSLREQIDALIQKKAVIAGSKSTSDVYLESLKSKRNMLQDQINASSRDIISKTPGIVSYHIDGYEEVLTPDAIKKFTPGFIDEIKSKDFNINANNMNVTADKPFVKVIKGIESYIVVSLDSAKARELKTGSNIKVRVNEIGKELIGNINYLSGDTGGRQIVSIRIDRAATDTLGLRRTKVELVKQSYEGLKVPLKSLRDINTDEMKAKIVLVWANCASIREVRILNMNDEFAIIESTGEGNKKGVSLYDTYIINPENIVEGQVITQ